MTENILTSDITLLSLLSIFIVLVVINVILFFQYRSKVRNYIKEKYPEKYKELGGLPSYAPMRYASPWTLFSILYGSENFNDPEFAKLKKKLKKRILTIGILCIIPFLLFLIGIVLKFS